MKEHNREKSHRAQEFPDPLGSLLLFLFFILSIIRETVLSNHDKLPHHSPEDNKS